MAQKKTFDAQAVEKQLGYKFKKKGLLKQSLTHRSFTNEGANAHLENNQRFEFLGDSVLDLVVSHLLMERYATATEGALSKTLASLINEKSLAELARAIRLGDFLILGKGEERTGGRNKDSLLADAFEAVIAAVYLDGGLKNAFKVIQTHFESIIAGQAPFTDYKTMLQELAQRHFKAAPNYKLIGQSGKDHEKTFETNVLIKQEIFGTGSGRSKKDSEQNAARMAIEKINAYLTSTSTEV